VRSLEERAAASSAPEILAIAYGEMEPIRRGRMLVKPLLPPNSLACIFGPSGSGKTFWANYLALNLSKGREFLGFKVPEAMPVAIRQGEAPGSGEVRLRGMGREMSISDAPLYMFSGNLDLLSDRVVDGVIDSIRRLLPGVGLVIIDTLASCMPGGDENSPADMGAVIGACHRIRDAFRCCVLLIHHSGKDTTKGARGHSMLRAAVDTEIEISEQSDVRIARITKARDAETGKEIAFRLRQIELGRDEDGDPITTCIVESADAPKRSTPVKGKNRQLAFNALLNGGRMNRTELIKHLKLQGVSQKRCWEAINGLIDDGVIVDTVAGLQVKS
jgi:putative DNA primase/helicase